MSNSIAPGSSADVNVKVTALTTNPNVPVTYKTIILKKNLVNGVNTLTQEMMSATNTKYVVKYDYVLGEDITAPTNCILEFDGGSISASGNNDTITGNNTQIKAIDVAIFKSGIIIAGTWNCPNITSAWFNDVTNENRIKQIFNLSSDNIYNTIIVNKGDYLISVASDGESVIELNSNSKVHILGTIRLSDNSFENYQIVNIANKENITICGDGAIIGDYENHSSSSGEWGMIINIDSSKNISINGLELSYAWGDSIYVTESSNISIAHCHLHHSRRQGVTVISCNFIDICFNKIENILGTAPGGGVCVEPNTSSQQTNNLNIINNYIKDCRKGVTLVAKYNDMVINNILIENNRIENIAVLAIDILTKSDGTATSCNIKNVCLVNNIIYDGYSVSFINIEGLTISNNNIQTFNSTNNKIHFCKRVNINNNSISLYRFTIENCENLIVDGNSIEYNNETGNSNYVLLSNCKSLAVCGNTIYGFRTIARDCDIILSSNKFFSLPALYSIELSNGIRVIANNNLFSVENSDYYPLIGVKGSNVYIDKNVFYNNSGSSISNYIIEVESSANKCRIVRNTFPDDASNLINDSGTNTEIIN